MVEFIYGSCSKEKRQFLMDKVKSSLSGGKKCLIIVPEQMTVTVEGYVAENFDNSTILNLEVLNFSRLCNRIFRTYGSLFYNEATKATRKLIMWKNMRELSPLLNFCDLNTNDFSSVDKMLATIKELKAYGVSPSDLDKIVENTSEPSDNVKKLSDVSLCYGAYQNSMKDIYHDSEDDMNIAISLLNGNDFFGDYEVFIDSFTSFTALQLKMISIIFNKAKNTFVTIDARKSDINAVHYASLLDTTDKLKKLTDEKSLSEYEIPEISASMDDGLSYLEKNLWNYEAPVFSENNDRISVTKCENVYSEAEYVATTVKKLVANGAQYSDIAVIARNAEKYEGIIDFVFDDYGIPYYLSEKVDLSSKPLVKFIISALRIIENNFQRQDVISFVRSGLCDIDTEEADMFCDYVCTWNISSKGFMSERDWSMNPDGFEKSISERGHVILGKANKVKNIIVPSLKNFGTSLSASKSVAETCKSVFSFLEKLNISEKIKASCNEKIKENDRQSAYEDAKLYRTVLEVLKNISLTFEEESLSLSEFITALNIMFSETEIGTIPTSNDSVLIGSASMLRTSFVKYSFCIGMNEGEFPSKLSQNGLLSENDRAFLKENGFSLSNGKDLKNSEELYYVYRAFTSPSEKLFLSYSSREVNGQSKSPSIAVNRVIKLFGTKVNIFDDSDVFDAIDSLESAKNKLPFIKGTKKEALLEILSENGMTLTNDGAINSIVNAKMQISESNLNDIFKDKISLSQTKLEQFNGCNMSFYLKSVLRLRESKKIVFSFFDIGRLVHGILEYFFESCEKNGKINICISEEEMDRKIKDATKKYLDEIIGDIPELSNKTKHLFKRIYDLSYLFIDEIRKEFSDSEFTPVKCEMEIGLKNSPIKPLEFKLKDNKTLSIHGVADRIDLYRNGEDSYIRIIDYKTGSKELKVKDIIEGYNTQLMIYLFSVCNSENFDTNGIKSALGIDGKGKIVPACIEYFSSKYKTETVAESAKFEDYKNSVEKSFIRSGLILDDENVLNAVSKSGNEAYTLDKKSRITLENLNLLFEEMKDAIKNISLSMLDGCADAKPKMHNGKYPCKYCEMKSICRNTSIDAKEGDD